MFKILTLDHLVLRARDAKKLARFYCEVLGCTLERELDIGLIQLRAGSSLIDIVPVDSELGRRGGYAPSLANEGKNLDHFCLRVDPFSESEIRDHLAQHGIEGGAVMEVYGAEGFGPSIYINDPEGNSVELKGPATRGPVTTAE